ncbi:MAG: NUDIX domain-containing protein [Clostridia bacterium]|nr:NUDIX domain-containing protein [Clostridia bacterium]
MIFDREMTATVYIVKDGRVLLHRHKKYNTWFAVGGHLHKDEFPHEAAYREVREETGLEIELISTEAAGDIELGAVERIPLPFITCREGIGSDTEFFDFIFIAKAKSCSLCPQDGESRDFRWFSREELLSENIKIHIKNTALAVLEKCGNL